MKIALLGDIALYGKYSIKNKNIFNYFKDVSEVLGEFDYVVGNLETPLCDYCEPKGAKSAHIRGTTQDVELLKFLNIDAVNLANNHIFDYGSAGCNLTKKVLEENNIEYFGIDNKQLIVKSEENSIAFSGYCCYSTNGNGYIEHASNVGVNILNADEVESNMINNHKNGNLNIVSVHAGEEHINYPNYDHIQLARFFASKVPYVYYGHHPHVMQGIENFQNSLLAYSLGNFCFDDVYTDKSNLPLISQSEENKKGIILALEIISNTIIRHEIIPIYMSEDKLLVNKNPEIIQDVKTYSGYLNLDKETFNKTRGMLLKKYVDSRKKTRNLEWYIKRLNLRSVKLIISLKKNKSLYKQYVLDYLNRNVVK